SASRRRMLHVRRVSWVKLVENADSRLLRAPARRRLSARGRRVQHAGGHDGSEADRGRPGEPADAVALGRPGSGRPVGPEKPEERREPRVERVRRDRPCMAPAGPDGRLPGFDLQGGPGNPVETASGTSGAADPAVLRPGWKGHHGHGPRGDREAPLPYDASEDVRLADAWVAGSGGGGTGPAPASWPVRALGA